VQASERSTNRQTGEARLGDGAVNDPLLAEAVEEALGDLVSVGAVSTLLMPLACRHSAAMYRPRPSPAVPTSIGLTGVVVVVEE
jgi:hypothetical protein